MELCRSPEEWHFWKYRGKVPFTRTTVFWEYRGIVPFTRTTVFWEYRGMVPFTRRSGVPLSRYAVNGKRGATALPFSIPAAPREIGASHYAHLPSARRRSAQLDVVSRFASGRHPWRPDLVVHSSIRRFQRGLNPIASAPVFIAKIVSLPEMPGGVNAYWACLARRYSEFECFYALILRSCSREW
ncbi:MAG: hypothetical protein H6R25_1626 [Proteobacteria bacterium]|nr:hypothetical protein [Pseudomonadota bacterium]